MIVNTYKMNINGFTSLCAKNGFAPLLFSPKNLKNKICAIVGDVFVPKEYKSEVIDIEHNYQMEGKTVLIITDLY